MPAAPHLGIDFGTSHTVAVLRRADGRVEALMFDGTSLLPSAVFAGPDGTISVGTDAAHSARVDPGSFEPHPKRRVDVGTVLLGEREFAVEDLFAAVLGEVRERCAEVAREVPASVTLTHPAAWGPTRKRILRAAAGKAGLPQARLLPEPVAAAAYYAEELHREVPPGAAVVVHDFGGGTFDASVVARTERGFEVLAVDGLDDLGGVDLDEALVQHLRGQYGDPAAWERLLSPGTAADRRHWRMFREDVRLTKERLSRQSVAELYIPVLERDVHVTREELERITTPLLARAVTVTSAVIEESGVAREAIAGVFLVGGGSRMPLVATLLHRELGRAPTITDHIEQVVAHGAILSADEAVAPAMPPPVAPPAPAPPAPPSVPPSRPRPSPDQRPMVLNVLSILLFLQAIASFFPIGGNPGLQMTTGALLVVSGAFIWWRKPLSRRILMGGQFFYLGVHLAMLMFGPSGDWTGFALQIPFLAAGLAGAELAASRASADWFRVPVGPLWIRRTVIRRIVTAVLVPAVLVSTLVSDPPWSAAEADPPKLILLATFGAEHAYVAFAMGDTTGVGARADGKIDVIRPLAEGVAETYEVGPEPLTSIALSEVSGRTVAVAGSDGAARIIDLGNGSELCRIDAPDHFAEMATGTSGGRPVVISGRSGGFGVWDAGSCVSHGRFDVAATGDGDIGILTLDGSAAAVFADDSGVTRGFDLSTSTATGERTSLPGRPALAVTADGDLVTALGKRLSVWDTATGSEKTRVDLDTPVRDGSLAVLRAGERLLAATVDEEGTLRVCDLDAGEEVGEYQFGLTESPPLLGFTGDGEPRLVFTADGQIAVFGL